jgi:hypothetical protein
MKSPGLADHSGHFPWPNQEKEQHGREGDNEGPADHCRVSHTKRVREGVLEDVDATTKKGQDEKAGKSPEGAHEAAANDQWLARTCSRSAMNDGYAHGSILGSVLANHCRFRESQEIEVTKDGWRIALLHDAAAGAAGILSLNFAVGFH